MTNGGWDDDDRAVRSSVLAAVLPLLVGLVPGCRCSKDGDGANVAPAGSTPETSAASAPKGKASASAAVFSAPIAAARVDGTEDVVVAGLDVAASAIRVQRIDAKNAVVTDRIALAGARWSSNVDLKLFAIEGGFAVTFHGLVDGKFTRKLVLLDKELVAKGEPSDVSAVACATREAIWFSDGKRVRSRAHSTPESADVALRGEGEVALVCGAHHAFAVVDEDDGASVVDLSAGGGKAHSVALLREKDFGEDDQRERGEFVVGDELGLVRLANSGAVAYRETKGGAAGPLGRAKTVIPRDDDVVAIDASSKAIVVVFTQDVSESCPKDRGVAPPSTRISALRIDRETREESTVELSAGVCGREVGPFFTGSLGEGISVAWVERASVVGTPRAPIASLAHAFVPPAGAVRPAARIDQPADALVDAGCDGKRCYAAALARNDGADAMVPGFARILHYP